MAYNFTKEDISTIIDALKLSAVVAMEHNKLADCMRFTNLGYELMKEVGIIVPDDKNEF